MQNKFRIAYTHIHSPLQFNNNYIFQAGRLYCTPSGIIEKHAHINWYELTIITDGEGIILTNEIPSQVSKGDIYLSCPGDFHEIQSSKNSPIKFDFYSFNTDNLKLKTIYKKITDNMYNFNQRIFKDENINKAVSLIISELGSDEKFKDEIISSLTDQILYRIIRNFDSVKLKKPKDEIDSYDELCFQIMHYIDTNIYHIKNLTEISDNFSYNYSYLSNLFKKHTDTTISEYYQTRRLDAARLLILSGELKINYIAQKLNYSSLYSFSKAFKNKYGISPKNYVKSIKNAISN